MSIKSRQRSIKRPSPEGKRPRLRGALSVPVPFSVTEFAKQATSANRRKSVGGAFGKLSKYAKRFRVEVAV